jgi:tetratricopeptide (TPR) repeat protein
MENQKSLSGDLRISLLVFVGVFIVYLLTLCPGIYAGPSAEAVCDAVGAGLTPPLSHPVWLFLGRFFSLFGSNTAYMMNLMSAFFGALTIGLLYLLLSQFVHGRTAEEDARYQVQPYLARVAALSGALLVAFCYPYWEGAVLAGSDTLNAFLLVFVVFLVWRYAVTSKARYAMLFGLFYGIALSNYPTLLLLAPIFAVYLLVRGRGLLDDPVAFVATFLLFLIGLLPALYLLPRGYLIEGKPYVVHATTFGQASSAFFDLYFRSMKNLFLQVSTLQDWIFWLFLPTFVPILFFLMKRGEYERGSETATRFTYLVRYAFVLLFTVGGLGYLWGFFIGPVGMAKLAFIKDARYLSSYVVVGAWFSYILGYWMIVTSGRFKPMGTQPEPKAKYRQAIYIATVVVGLALPVATIVMSYDKSTKRGVYAAEDFARGILESSPEGAVIVVPIDPFYGSVGAPLRYIHSQQKTPMSGRERTIIDLNAAYIDFYRTKRIKTAQYLSETLLGRKVERPRVMFLPEDPFRGVYDRFVWWERVRAGDAKERPRAICGLANNFFGSDIRADNDLMNVEFTAEPTGLLYLYRDKNEYCDAGELIDHNEKLWNKVQLRLRAGKGEKRSELEEYILGEYSKSSNDFGLLCQLAGKMDLAEKRYRRAVDWLPENSSAIWNLASVIDSKGDKDKADGLRTKALSLLKEQQEADVIRRLGAALDLKRLWASQLFLAKEEQPNAAPRRMAILRLAANMDEDNLSVREQMGDLLMSSETIKEALRSYERVPSAMQAIAEYLMALEAVGSQDEKASRWFRRKLGRAYAELGQNTRAEELFGKALDDEDASSVTELMQFYLTTDQKPERIKELGRRIIEKVPADDQQKKAFADTKWNATAIVVNLLLQQNEMEKAKDTVRAYLQEYRREANRLLVMAEAFLRDPRFDPFTIWLYEEYANLGEELRLPRLLELAAVYFRQKRYADIVGMKQPAQTGLSAEMAQFCHWKGIAYEELGKNEEAEKAFEEARSFLPADSGALGAVVMNNLAWRYFKNGKLERAKELAEEALRRDPGNSLVWDTCGWILYKTGGDLQRATGLIRQSHLANPDNGIIAYHYGKLLMETGQTGKALFLLELAVERGIEGKEELEDAQAILKSRQGNGGNT